MAEEEPRDLSLASTWRPHTTSDDGAERAARKFCEMTYGILNVAECDLTSFPPELGQCQALKRLYCQQNQLVALPPELGQCQALEGLYCHHNQLVALPPELGQCQALGRLDCDHNQLVALPPELGQCRSLQWLFWSNNPMTEFEVPNEYYTLDFLKEQWASRPITKSALKG